MILLEYHNRIILEKLQSILEAEKKENFSFIVADFDGVLFKLTTGDKPTSLTLSLKWKVAAELLKQGGNEELKAVYGNFLQGSPESGWDVTLAFDVEAIPGDKQKFFEAASLLKRHLLAAPFKKVFKAIEAGQNAGGVISLDYRDEESIYIKGDADKVIVIFSINFKDPGDQVLGKVFLQEYANARRDINNAPAVSYSTREAPLEIKGVPGVKETDTHSFVSFVLFKAHFQEKNRERTINNIQTFRDYLHYHIKCSKGDMHTRMRARVDKFLQVMNQARPQTEPKEKKTMAGKTFTKK
jgi:actin related protein 2/3 complex subunit 2